MRLQWWRKWVKLFRQLKWVAKLVNVAVWMHCLWYKHEHEHIWLLCIVRHSTVSRRQLLEDWSNLLDGFLDIVPDCALIEGSDIFADYIVTARPTIWNDSDGGPTVALTVPHQIDGTKPVLNDEKNSCWNWTIWVKSQSCNRCAVTGDICL